jgi:hypothetical protein
MGRKNVGRLKKSGLKMSNPFDSDYYISDDVLYEISIMDGYDSDFYFEGESCFNYEAYKLRKSREEKCKKPKPIKAVPQSDGPFKAKVTKTPKSYFSNPDRHPTEETLDWWIIEHFEYPSEQLPYSGKWLVFTSEDSINSVWALLRNATREGKLGYAAKTSTKLGYKGSDYVICVYTKDYRNEKDVFRVREELRKLGITKRIPYKTDRATLEKKYACAGQKVSLYYV